MALGGLRADMTDDDDWLNVERTPLIMILEAVALGLGMLCIFFGGLF
jgi:hypothetical protein